MRFLCCLYTHHTFSIVLQVQVLNLNSRLESGFTFFQPGPYSETKTDLEKNRKLVRWVYKVGKLHLT